MEAPTDYRAGLARARLVDPDLAERYVRFTLVGDPIADAAIMACATASAEQQAAWIRGGMDGGPAAIPEAPAALRELFAAAELTPSWFDPRRTLPGCRAFHGNSEMFIGAFVAAVLIEGFSTLISKSFSITGRVVDQGVRRLKQNNRHIAEIFLPGGLERHGEGWKLSLRVRLVHARLRFMLSRSSDWDASAWGTPLSAAHMAFATAAFSGGLLQRARMLGVELTAEERESFMLVWRYTGHLMGVEPALQVETEDEAMRLFQIGRLCEPPPDLESIQMANCLINSAPIVAGITEPQARRKLARLVYRVSRALIGDTLADQLHFPPDRGLGVLTVFRWRNRFDRVVRRTFPVLDRRRRSGLFGQMIELSSYDDGGGISYRLPQHLYAEQDRPR